MNVQESSILLITKICDSKNPPIGSDESTIIASYFPSGEFLRKSTAAKQKQVYYEL